MFILAQLTSLTNDTGIALGVVLSLIGCTWFLASRASGIISSTKSLTSSINGLRADFTTHVTESRNRDDENTREHYAINRQLDVFAETVKSINKRIDRTEAQCDSHDHTMAEVQTKVALLEAKEP